MSSVEYLIKMGIWITCKSWQDDIKSNKMGVLVTLRT